LGKSVYNGWDSSLAVNIHDVTVTKPGWSARRVPGVPRDFAKLRRMQPTNKLLPATIDWILALPPRVRPHALAKQFARIANGLCYLWHDRGACLAYFGDLLTDRRGGRQGFPSAVEQELRALWRYYQRLASAPGSHQATGGDTSTAELRDSR
jgi:hypothetical protein